MPTDKLEPFSLRLPASVVVALEAAARRQSTYGSKLAAELVTTGIRSIEHPAIDFERDAEGGRKARLAGRRVAVWIVVDTVRRLGREKAAVNLGLPASLVVAALNYAAAFPDDIREDERRGTRDLAECGLAEAGR